MQFLFLSVLVLSTIASTGATCSLDSSNLPPHGTLGNCTTTITANTTCFLSCEANFAASARVGPSCHEDNTVTWPEFTCRDLSCTAVDVLPEGATINTCTAAAPGTGCVLWCADGYYPSGMPMPGTCTLNPDGLSSSWQGHSIDCASTALTPAQLGGIIGGSVAGGLVLIGFIIWVIWLWRRDREATRELAAMTAKLNAMGSNDVADSANDASADAWSNDVDGDADLQSVDANSESHDADSNNTQSGSSQ